jgi:hypothetical protein
MIRNTGNDWASAEGFGVSGLGDGATPSNERSDVRHFWRGISNWDMLRHRGWA